MNILFIECNFYPTMGGVERVTYTLGEALREKGHQVYYAFYGKDDENLAVGYKMIFNQSLSDEDLYSQFDGFLSKNHIALLICQNVHIPRYQNIYKRLKKNHSVKIITCYHANPDIWVNKNKWGYTFNSIYIKELIRTIYFKVFGNPYKINQRGMYEISDRYILLSDSFKSIFCKLNNVDGNKLLAIPNPCPFSEDKENGTCKKENIVLVVARMAEQQKRLSNVIEIWSRLESEFKDWKLVMVGDGPNLTDYQQMVKNRNLNNVKFIGSSKSPQEFYQKAKIFLMTSIWEGFGMTLIEAQNYGCVPVAYDSYSAVEDIINNGENGFIVHTHDLDRYVENVRKLMANPSLWERMSYSCIESIKGKFEKDTIVNKWFELAEQIGGGKDNIVLVVARMAEQQKRILETLKIWNLVYSNHLDWKLIIVGDGPDLSQYKTTANKMNVSNVQFVGSTSTPQDYYRKAKIFMMTSIWEGLPMTLIEAQHFGCVPIVYDSFASVHDIINNGKDGFIIPLHDRENYKNQLEKMMSSPKELYRMSQLCMSNTFFGIGDILHKWNNIINSL